jgi:uncharacterized protein YciI
MKKLLIVLLLLLSAKVAIAQKNAQKFDKKLAEKLGADEYGMKQYILVILKTGPVKMENKTVTDSLFRGHMNNIERLAKAGKLVVAGPITKNERNYRGIFILDVKTLEEANALILTDPVIKEKLMEAEMYQWYGSAALPEYLPAHERIQKQKP